MLCRFGPTVIDYLEEDDAYRIYVYWCVLGGYLSLLGAVCRLRRRGNKPIRAYVDTADPAERRLGRVLTLLGARSWDGPDDHRCFEFYLPIKKG